MTVLDTNEKPTRPPPRKFKLTAKPATTPSLVTPATTTTSTSSSTPTTTSTTSTITTVVKPKWKTLDKKAKKTKLQPWKKNKKLNQQQKKTLKRSKTSVRDKPKPKATDDLKSNALKNTNSPKNRTILHERNSFKWKKSQKHEFTNKTQTDLNVRTNRTMQNTLKVKRKQSKNAKAL